MYKSTKRGNSEQWRDLQKRTKFLTKEFKNINNPPLVWKPYQTIPYMHSQEFTHFKIQCPKAKQAHYQPPHNTNKASQPPIKQSSYPEPMREVPGRPNWAITGSRIQEIRIGGRRRIGGEAKCESELQLVALLGLLSPALGARRVFGAGPVFPSISELAVGGGVNLFLYMPIMRFHPKP